MHSLLRTAINMTLPPTLVPTVLAALAASSLAALAIGFFQHTKTKRLSDMIPLRRGREADVRSEAEFAATTVATTISLATVVMAYFELAGFFGLWIFWTVLTTAAGLLAVRFIAGRIAERLKEFGERIPTLHELIGVAFNSRAVTITAAAATSLGYLGAYAVELTVGSRLFTSLVPGVPEWLAVVILATIGFTYTAAGGFRAVVLTDRLQMATIWIFIAALSVFYFLSIAHAGGLSAAVQALPESSRQITWPPGIGAFLVGVFFINVPSYVSDIGMWQRVSSSRHLDGLRRGLTRSAISASGSWALLALVAIAAPAVTRPTGDVHPLAGLLITIAQSPVVGAVVVLFLVVAGLYAAMMSTASTMLVAVAHTAYEDVLQRGSHLTDDERADSSQHLRSARLLLVSAALLAVGIVELLSYAHFTIADFVFAIFGAQLSLFPAVCAALYLPSERLRKHSGWAIAAISCGFFSGWGAALYGKLNHADTIVFLAPVVSLVTASILLLGVLLDAKRGASGRTC